MNRVSKPLPVGFDDIVAARRRIGKLVRLTPVVSDADLDDRLGCTLFCKCENLQATGSFKLRGALNAVLHLRESGIAADVATHSSGNHGAALALAARHDSRKAYVVMPENAVDIKIRHVRHHQGEIVFCRPTNDARAAGLDGLVEGGLIPIHPYDHPDIIAGQGTAALEFLEQQPGLEILMTPVGGGGLVSGSAIAAHHLQPGIRVLAAEPAGAADTAASFRRGARVRDWEPRTIADGLRAVVGEMTFPIIRELVEDVLTVSEEAILEGMQMAWHYLELAIEPSSATVLAAMLEYPDVFAGRSVGVILSGGNVDPDRFPRFTAGEHGA